LKDDGDEQGVLVMQKTEDGGPAFPLQTAEYFPSLNKTHAGRAQPGMTLRDWFAGQALPAVLALSHEALIAVAKKNGVSETDAAALGAYELADAMIRARHPGAS
jgi:hypothetical protein